jgi:hypothetical protein
MKSMGKISVAGSYTKIDYRVRPAKYAERMMMIDAFRKLRFSNIESYQYIGLGSVYFSDFSLVHRALGIGKLISIEKNEEDRARFEENIPYSAIEMLWGKTSSQLPKVRLDLRSIVWMHYDGRLDRSVLADVAHIAGQAAGGSVLAVTVQCRFDRVTHDDGSDASLDALIGSLGAERVPHDLATKDLLGKGTGALFRRILLSEIDDALAARNAVLPAGQAVKYRQIFNFRYEDGVQMMTIGVVFYDAGQGVLLELCGFDELPFIRRDEEVFDIRIPKLTPIEVKRLERQLPLEGARTLERGPIPERDATQYARLYRYFPNIAFVDS